MSLKLFAAHFFAIYFLFGVAYHWFTGDTWDISLQEGLIACIPPALLAGALWLVYTFGPTVWGWMNSKTSKKKKS